MPRPVTLLIWLLLMIKSCHSSPGVISKGPDGGYYNIIVAIHRSVPENTNLISKIKELFTLSSPILYKATFGAAYFRNVIISVPNTWRHSPTYENATEDLYEKAQFRIEGPTSKYGDEPNTIQENGCGQPGSYTHLTPNYLLKDFVSKWPAKHYEKKEKRLIQEWARLRYGVFEEYGHPGDVQYPSVQKKNDQLLVTVCGASVPGTFDLICPVSHIEGGKPDIENPINCSYVPFIDPLETPGASIMFTASVPNIDYFCDDTEERRHNSKTPSRHNQLCGGRSTWSVISETEDFKNSQSRRLMAQYSRQVRQAVDTKFQVVRTPGSADGKIAFVLDVSGSMRGRPMDLLHAAASRALRDHVPDGSRVAVVAFSSKARTLANLTTVNEQTKIWLLDKLPKNDDQGYTAIGQGLLRGLDSVADGLGRAQGTRLILVTDGEENVGPSIMDVIPSLTLSGTQVMAIAFGTKATQKLERLALATNGRVFLFPDLNGKKPASALDSAFLESTTFLVSEEQQPIRIVEEMLNLNQEWTERPLLVEETLGRNLVITVTASDIRPIQLTLIDPNGKSIGPGNSIYNKDESSLQRIRLEVPSAVKGTWKLSLRTAAEPTTVELSVLSHPQNYASNPAAPRPLRIRAWVDDIQPTYPAAVRILAQVVTNGQEPVPGATVTATVTGNKSVDVELRDDGAGADVSAGDGIYSGFFTQYTGNGRYAVFVRMINYPGVNQNRGSSRIRRSISSAPTERVADAGSFRLDGWTKEDLVPPSRVIDLLALQKSGQTERFWLTWTAPGDDMDHGRAFKIDVKVSHDPDLLRQNFTSCSSATYLFVHNLTITQGGEKQMVEMVIPESSNSTLYIALRASDRSENISPISNVASLSLNSPVNSALRREGEQNELLVPLVAGFMALLVLIAFAGLVLLIYTRRKNNKSKMHYFSVRAESKEFE